MKIIYTNKKEEIFLDDGDFELLSNYTWYLDNGYARTNSKKLSAYMHKLILNIKDKTIFCDHIDGNRANNQKHNLRLCNIQQNAQNRIPRNKYKGISFKKKFNKYESNIGIDGKLIYLGYFDSEIEAAEKYDIAAIYYHKEFAKLNFPEKKNSYPEYVK